MPDLLRDLSIGKAGRPLLAAGHDSVTWNFVMHLARYRLKLKTKADFGFDLTGRTFHIGTGPEGNYFIILAPRSLGSGSSAPRDADGFLSGQTAVRPEHGRAMANLIAWLCSTLQE